MSLTEPHAYEEFEWTVTPLTGTFGAELSGKHLRDEENGDNIRALLERHLVLTFRGQFLTHAEQSTIAHAMGEPTPAHPVVPGHPDFPEMLVLDGARGGKNARWHTDVTFVEAPPAISILVNDHTPVAGGDTLWSDTRTAYERLHPALREALDQLQAVHRISPLAYWGEPFDTALGRDDVQELYDAALKVPPVTHPVVRRHPSTGRPSLFVNPGFTTHLAGVSRIESEHLLKLLYEHQTQPELTLRHHWLNGDVVMWDNRSTMHYATDDYGTAERRMRRITLRGTRPVGVRGFESHVVSDPLESVR
jgi:taurine dioxygenase